MIVVWCTIRFHEGGLERISAFHHHIPYMTFSLQIFVIGEDGNLYIRDDHDAPLMAPATTFVWTTLGDTKLPAVTENILLCKKMLETDASGEENASLAETVVVHHNGRQHTTATTTRCILFTQGQQ